MSKKHHDWVIDFLRGGIKVNARICSLNNGLTVQKVGQLLSQQLCKLPLNEDKFKLLINSKVT